MYDGVIVQWQVKGEVCRGKYRGRKDIIRLMSII